jgi:CMP-N,N'-diacetyllegionaminic acid synthase
MSAACGTSRVAEAGTIPVSGALALVPARGGSKGIPLKNLAPVLGKSLLAYAVEAAQASGVITTTFVSSDSDAILDAGAKLGAIPLRRPDELATDMASSDAVIAHFIETQGLAKAPDQLIVLLQPTSPLRTGAHIAQGVALWRARKPRTVVSVYEPDHHPAKSFRLDEQGFLVGMFSDDAPFTPRQQLPRALNPNGAIYVFSVADFLAEGCIPRRGMAPLIMDLADSLDIDSPDHLIWAEQRLRRNP